MSWKNISIIVMLAVAVFSCNNDDDDKEKHDPVAQALIDDDLLVEFLQSHYLTPEKEIDTILNDETSLYELVKIKDVEKNDINYKLYYYIDQEGSGINPSMNDSVQMVYRGFLLDSTMFDQNLSYASKRSWLALTNVIDGWRYGMPNYKSGDKVIYPDESFGYENTGEGIIFMPSGLAYGEFASPTIPANSCLYFFVGLGKVVIADSDNDGLTNNEEDLDQDGNANNDDTDEDGVPNFLDVDDDNDGIPTKDEIANGKDADCDNDGIPDYLDDDECP